MGLPFIGRLTVSVLVSELTIVWAVGGWSLGRASGSQFSAEAESVVTNTAQNSARVGPAWLARQTLSCHLLSVLWSVWDLCPTSGLVKVVFLFFLLEVMPVCVTAFSKVTNCVILFYTSSRHLLSMQLSGGHSMTQVMPHCCCS